VEELAAHLAEIDAELVRLEADPQATGGVFRAV
jgi:hypothetical protein